MKLPSSYLFPVVTLTACAACFAAAPRGQTETPKPPFTLTISINPSNPTQDDTGDKTVSVRAGVTVRIRKTNVIAHEIPKQGPDNGPFQCIFEVRDSNGNPAPLHKETGQQFLGGGPVPLFGTKDMVLQPGESKIDFAPVSEWYDLSKPGTYTIEVSQHVSSSPNSAVVRSNKITVTIKP